MATTGSALECHRLQVPEPRAVPFAVGDFDSIGPLSRANYPHRHTFYEIVLLTAGRGRHVIDFVDYELRPPQLGLLSPGQVHYWDAVGLRGHVMLFDESFLARPTDLRHWRAHRAAPWRNLETVGANDLLGLLRQLESEGVRREAGFLSAAQALLHVFLVRVARYSTGVRPPVADRATMVAAQFDELLARCAVDSDSVGDYAARLGLSASYLSEVVKSVTGSSPGRLIRRARALEARRLLAGTDMAVAQVSRAVGFEDPAYFCRFFRRETGISPGQYRRETGGKHQLPRDESIDPSAGRA